MENKFIKTHEFNVKITWTSGREGIINLEEKPSLPLSSPPQWSGKSAAYSPQDLFISALAGCFVTTFATMMSRMRQPLHAYQVSGKGIVHPHPDGGWHFTKLNILIEITVPKNALLSKVKRAVTLTEKYCQISRSVNFEIKVQSEIIQLD